MEILYDVIVLFIISDINFSKLLLDKVFLINSSVVGYEISKIFVWFGLILFILSWIVDNPCKFYFCFLIIFLLLLNWHSRLSRYACSDVRFLSVYYIFYFDSPPMVSSLMKLLEVPGGSIFSFFFIPHLFSCCWSCWSICMEPWDT